MLPSELQSNSTDMLLCVQIEADGPGNRRGERDTRGRVEVTQVLPASHKVWLWAKHNLKGHRLKAHTQHIWWFTHSHSSTSQTSVKTNSSLLWRTPTVLSVIYYFFHTTWCSSKLWFSATKMTNNLKEIEVLKWVLTWSKLSAGQK